MAWPNQKFTKE
jgi:hypothetical protein